MLLYFLKMVETAGPGFLYSQFKLGGFSIISMVFWHLKRGISYFSRENNCFLWSFSIFLFQICVHFHYSVIWRSYDSIIKSQSCDKQAKCLYQIFTSCISIFDCFFLKRDKQDVTRKSQDSMIVFYSSKCFVFWAITVM